MAAVITFPYSVGDEVLIKALDLKGRVVALLYDTEGVSIRIAYWSDGSRKVEWVFPDEVTI